MLRPLVSKIRSCVVPSSTRSLSSFRAPPPRARTVHANGGTSNVYDHEYGWLDDITVTSPRLDTDKETTTSDSIAPSEFGDVDRRRARAAAVTTAGAAASGVHNQYGIGIDLGYDYDRGSELGLMQHKGSPSGFSSYRLSKESSATSPTLTSPTQEKYWSTPSSGRNVLKE